MDTIFTKIFCRYNIVTNKNKTINNAENTQHIIYTSGDSISRWIFLNQNWLNKDIVNTVTFTIWTKLDDIPKDVFIAGIVIRLYVGSSYVDKNNICLTIN